MSAGENGGDDVSTAEKIERINEFRSGERSAESVEEVIDRPSSSEEEEQSDGNSDDDSSTDIGTNATFTRSFVESADMRTHAFRGEL